MRDYAELVKALRHCIITIPCNGCPYYSNGNKPSKECATMNVAAADAIEELLAKVPKWISVEERLPPVYKNVLSCDKYGLVKENYMISDKSWSVGYHITHWMPLPAPPKGVE